MGKKNWKRLCTWIGILALLAAIAYGVYYFFFAEDEAELDDDFFEDEEKADGEQEEPAAEPAEAAPAQA
ncbi:MAG: hypothetical protein J5496_00520 [Lachnospiraceae bacterium]|nr:hypothetical protein [Lachnospiraceae bacterium]